MKMNPESVELLRVWETLSGLPGGKFLFSKILGQFVPYSGSIGAVVEELKPGYCRAHVTDKRGIRNHLSSIHAIALANIGEIVTGVSMMVSIPKNQRIILKSLKIDYEKKARGTLTAECTLPEDITFPEVATDHVIKSTVKDAKGDVVARVEATWRAGVKR